MAAIVAVVRSIVSVHYHATANQLAANRGGARRALSNILFAANLAVFGIELGRTPYCAIRYVAIPTNQSDVVRIIFNVVRAVRHRTVLSDMNNKRVNSKRPARYPRCGGDVIEKTVVVLRDGAGFDREARLLF